MKLKNERNTRYGAQGFSLCPIFLFYKVFFRGEQTGRCLETQKNRKKGLKKGGTWFTMEPSGEKW